MPYTSLSEVHKFIEDNDKAMVQKYFEQSIQNVRDLNATISKMSLYICLTVIVAYLCIQAGATKINFGLFVIEDKRLLIKAIPVVFSFFMFRYTLLLDYRNKVYITLMNLFDYLFTKNPVNPAPSRHRYFKELLISIHLEVSFSNKLVQARPGSFWLFGIPLGIVILILPVFIEAYFLYTMCKTYHFDWLSLVSLFFSVWFFCFTILCFQKTPILKV